MYQRLVVNNWKDFRHMREFGREVAHEATRDQVVANFMADQLEKILDVHIR